MWKLNSSYGANNLNDRCGEPAAFKREMGSFASKFLGFDQHDSQEFLQYALEGIHIELNKGEGFKKKKEVNNNQV